MHPALRALFDEHASPTHASKRDVHNQLGLILTASTAVRKQVLEYKTLLEQAELADHDHQLDGTMEHISQRFASIERELNAAVQHERNLAAIFVELDRYMTEQQAHAENPSGAQAAE
jgi:hypothetical protein